MADFAVGEFSSPTSTGTVTVDTLSFEPKAIIVWAVYTTNESVAAPAAFSMGFTDGTVEHSAGSVHVSSFSGSNWANNSLCGITKATGNPTIIGAIDSMESDGFVVDFTTVAADAVVWKFLAIGGAGVSAKAGQGLMADNTVSSLGFDPNCVFAFLTNSLANSNSSDPGFTYGVSVGTGSTDSWSVGWQAGPFGFPQDKSSRLLAGSVCSQFEAGGTGSEVQITGFGTGEFDFEATSTVNEFTPWWYLAMDIDEDLDVGIFNKSTSTSIPVSQDLPTLTDIPQAVMLTTAGKTTESPGANDDVLVALGATTGDDQGHVLMTDEDNTANGDCRQDNDLTLSYGGMGATQTVKADLDTLSDTTPTISWTANTANADKIGYIAFGGGASAGSEQLGVGSGSSASGGSAAGGVEVAAAGSGASASGSSAAAGVEKLGAGSGASTSTGTASGNVEKLGAGSGASTSNGTVLAGVERSASGSGASTSAGTAAGGTEIPGAGTGASTSTGSVAGGVEKLGSGTGASTSTGTATGDTTSEALGSGSGASASTGTAAGGVERAASGTGTSTSTGTASSGAERGATATGASTSDGSAVGEIEGSLLGAGTGASTSTGTAAGGVERAASATGSSASSSSATATVEKLGTGTGASTSAGTATAEVIADALGTGTGASTSTGSAAAIVERGAAGTGAAVSGGSAVGATAGNIEGAGTGAAVSGGSAAGGVEKLGSGTGAAVSDGSAAGQKEKQGAGSGASASTGSASAVIERGGSGTGVAASAAVVSAIMDRVASATGVATSGGIIIASITGSAVVQEPTRLRSGPSGVSSLRSGPSGSSLNSG